MYCYVAFPCFSWLKKTEKDTHIYKNARFIPSFPQTWPGEVWPFNIHKKMLVSALIFCHFWRILRFPLVWKPPKKVASFRPRTTRTTLLKSPRFSRVFPGSLRWAAEITTLQGMWTTCAWWRHVGTGDWNSSGDVWTKPWETMIRYGGFTGCTPKWKVYKGKILY